MAIIIIVFRPYGKEVPHESFWTAFQEIVLNAGGRPHWAKVCKTHARDIGHSWPMQTILH